MRVLLTARIAHRLPAWLLATSLSLLMVPAIASACSNPLTITHTWTGAGADANWTNPANWNPGVPGAGSVVCIPAASAPSGSADAPVVDTPSALVSAIQTEAGAGLAISLGNQLAVGPATAGTTAFHGDTTINAGTLVLGANAVYDDGSMVVVNGGRLEINASFQLTVNGGMDITDLGGGTNTVANAGTIVTNATDPLDPVFIGPALQNQGSVVNATGTLRLFGGGSGGGAWRLGSQPGSSVELFGTSQYQFDGVISDAASGGQGKLVVDNSTLLMSGSTPDIDVHELVLRGVAGVSGEIDYTGTNPTSIDILTVEGGILEMSAGMTTVKTTMRDGKMIGGGGSWTASTFHFGGGTLEAAGVSDSFTVGTLDMTQVAGDTGTRATIARGLVVTGAGTQNFPFSAGTFDLGGTLTIGAGGTFVVQNDIDSTFGGTVLVHGKLESASAGTVAIAPTVDVPDGTIAVTQGLLVLANPPVQYDGANDTLAAGTYVLAGTLRFPGPVAATSADVQFNGGHLEDSSAGNADALTTLTSNATGNDLTLSGGSQLTPPATFTNRGTVNLAGTAQIVVAPGSSYISNDPAAVTNLGTAGSGLNVSGGGQVTLSQGTLSGIGTVTGNVFNTGGTVAPGNSPGTITVDGNYLQFGSGVMRAEIAGPAAGQFDRLIVTGQANLGGTLIMQGLGGYDPPDGQSFDLITAATRVGTFASLVQFPDHPYFDAYYGAGATPALRVVANSLSVSDAVVTEGDAGTVNATFTISLGTAAPAAVAVDWATQDGSAQAGSDYTAGAGTVNFAPGETGKTVAVAVNGDTAAEGGENFAVNLSNPVNSLIRDGQGVGTITDDEPVPVAAGPGPVAQPSAVPPGDIDGFPVPAPPIQGKKVNLEPTSGTVLVRLPRTTKFVRLPDAEQVPVGTIVDARKGVVRLYSVGRNGRVQSALFYQGTFQIFQKVGQAMTELRLFGGNFARACRTARRATASANRRSKGGGSKSVRHLWGSGSGQFRTKGRYASATIRGTKWLTDDRCNSTLVRVRVGSVTVRDLTLKKQLVLKKPKTYVAPARRPRR